MVLVAMAFSAFLLHQSASIPGQYSGPEMLFAADSLNLEGLPKDPRQFRAHVDQLIGKVDILIKKLKADPKAQTMTLDLIQTRDDILREITKIESAPGDAKWTAGEMRESVQAKLKLLKDQYDKAIAMAS
jgi:hypothetical protein